jgi:hypothetical protein
MGRLGCLQSIADLVGVAISMAFDPPAFCTLPIALCPRHRLLLQQATLRNLICLTHASRLSIIVVSP